MRLVSGEVMAKCSADYVTPDIWTGQVTEPVVSRATEVRRREWLCVSVEVVDELCEWCGVDRKGGCGACSDLK